MPKKKNTSHVEEIHSLFEATLNAIPDVIGIRDSNHRILCYNKAGYEFFRKSHEEVKGKKCFEMLGYHIPCETCAVSEVYKTKQPAAIKRHIKSIGLCLDIRAYPVLDEKGEIINVIEHLHNISEEKMEENIVRENEEKYRTLFNNIADPVIIFDKKTKRLLDCNQAAITKYGYTYDEFLTMKPHNLHPEDEWETVEKNIDNIKDSTPRYYTHVTKGGKKFHVEIHTRELELKGKKALISTIRDITERKKAEKKLKKSEDQKERLSKQIEQLSLSVADMITAEKPQEVFDKISKAIIDHSDFRRVLISYFKDVSPYRDIIGYYGLDKKTVQRLRKIEMPKNRYLDLFEKGLRVGQFSAYIPYTMKDILDKEATVFGTGPVPENEDTWHPEDNLFVRMDDRKGNLIGVISVDESKSGQKPTTETVRPLEIFSRIISEIIIHKKAEQKLKELERQLFHAQKMESIGRLAGGIAHDFNNILTSIMGFSELLKSKFLNLNTLEGKASNTIFNASQRAANLTRQLLGFARGGKYNPKPLNINKVIIEIMKISENIFEKNINVKYELEDNIHTIEADRNQLDQVLTNIVINSKDAMPRGGELILKTENVFIDEEYSSRYPEFKPGHYVKISITDTGFGISKELKDRIFEPFFTTKEKGTGLGLATVYGILKNHKGHINCYSEPGEGTTFTIYFPFSKKEIIDEKNETKFIKGTETVLVVDDEKDVIILTKTLLENLGYKVLIAYDGLEAIEIYQKKKNKIDLVLLDLIMPNQAGVKTFWELKKINPEVKVLLMSGFSQNGKATKILNGGAKGFIQKPFKLYELSKILSEVLNQ